MQAGQAMLTVTHARMHPQRPHDTPTAAAVAVLSRQRWQVRVLGVLLLMLVAMSPGRSAEAKEVTTVNVLSLLYSPDFPNDVVDSINAGLGASLAARRDDMEPVVRVSLVRPSSYNESMETLFTTTVRESGDEPLVIVGPMGNDNVLLLRDKLEEHDLVAFAPLSWSDDVRGWNPHLYYPSVEPDAELLALIRYAVVVLRLPRVGFMYLKGTDFGESSFEYAQDVMDMMGYNLCCTFAIEGGAIDQTTQQEFDAEWEGFVKTRPQATLLFGSPHDVTEKFIKNMAQDDRVSGAYILSPSNLQSFLFTNWKKATAETRRDLRPGQLIITGTSPLATDVRYKAIQRFQEEVKEYLSTNEDWGGFAKPEPFDTNHNNGELMVLGWLAGEVLARALFDSISLKNRTLFMLSLYNQRRYLIDDIVIGDFGGDCSDEARRQGAAQRCNQGGNMVYMKKVESDYHLEPVIEGFLTWGTSQCYSDGVRVSSPLSGLVILFSDHEAARRANTQYVEGATTFMGTGRIGDDDRLFIHPLNTTFAGAADDLEGSRDEVIISAIFAVVTKEVLSIRGVVFLDPILTVPTLTKFDKNVIHFSPTLNQELYVLSRFVSRSGTLGTHAVIRSDEAAEIAEVLSMSLLTFASSLRSRVLLGVGDTIRDSDLKHDGDIFILGLTVPDVKLVSRFLDSHPQSRVVITFTDLVLLYDELKSEFNATSDTKASRLIFATSLPHWADTTSASGTVTAYHGAVPDQQQWSPMSLRGFTVARLVQTLLFPMRSVNATSLSQQVFWQGSFIVDDMKYGPFNDIDCIADGEQLSSNCVWNYGATDITVWSFARALDPSLPLLQDPATPSMEYKRLRAGLTSSEVAGIAVGLVLALVLFCTLGVVLFFTLRDKRDNERAPREPADPVTLVFTDIESSTAQWASHPDLMTDAVAAHHRLIRSLILKHDCYEVKTIGDSFMIASKSPYKAVLLAADLQLSFLHNDWGTDAHDRFYCESEEARAQEDSEYIRATASLDPEVYRQLWCGLRVRVGIHTGLCDIRHDEVTKGYDYYGPTTNMAARTESVANGGQVLLTHATYMSLSESERGLLDTTDLGAVSLRGVPQPVRLYQFNAVPGRNFAALRLDQEYFFDDGNEATNSTSENSSSRAELGESAQMIMASLQMLLSTFRGPQREKLLLPYCERWRVPLPRDTARVWDEGYCQEVMRRIAAKVGHVADHCVTTTSNHTVSTISSESVIIISENKAFLDACTAMF